jgi:putative transposase
MSSLVRTVYHTHIKCLVRDGLLAAPLLQQIPRSNVSRWKAEPHNKYFDLGLNIKTATDMETIKDFIQDRRARRIYAAYVRIVKMVISFAQDIPQFHRSVKVHSKKVVELVLRVKDYIGLKRALRFFNISVATYRNWSLLSITQCFQSLTGKCNRVFHNQLARPELTKLKDLLTDAQFQYWPVSSIALYALRKNILPLSLNTWYKYVNKLGLARTKPVSRRKKNTISIRAERAHQIWHADITMFTTADQARHYIYLVADNFSRKIVAWKIARTVNAAFREQTIEDALRNVRVPLQNISLITDGGHENKIQEFLSTIGQPIRQHTALVDVHYSNSLIEAHNKLIKYNYLYRMDITDGSRLEKVFLKIVKDFNNRPHISLNGLTPNEAEQNLSIDREQLCLYIKKHRRNGKTTIKLTTATTVQTDSVCPN